MPDREPHDRHRERGGQRTAGRGQGQGGAEGTEQGVDVQPGGGAPHQPPQQARHGHHERQGDQQGEAGDDGGPAPPEGDALAGPADPRPDARAPPTPAQGQLEDEQHGAEADQHQGEQRGLRSVEHGGVLLEDRGGQRGVVEQLQCAVLGEEVEPDEEGAAQDRRADGGQRDPPEDAAGPVAQRLRHLLDAGVEPAQRGDRGQVDQRVVGQRHHQDGTAEALHGVGGGDPAVAVDEGGHRERRAQQAVPPAATGQVGALDHPRRGRAEGHAERGPDEQQAHGVPQQLAHARADQEVARLPGLELGGGPQHVAEGDEGGGRDEEPDEHQRPRRALVGPPTAGAGRDRRHRGAQRKPTSVMRSTTVRESRSETSTRGGWSSSKGLTGGSSRTSGLRGYSRA